MESSQAGSVWQNMEIAASSASLFLCSRRSKRIALGRVSISDVVGADLVELVRDRVQSLARMEALPYSETAIAEDGRYFLGHLSTIVNSVGDEADEHADLQDQRGETQLAIHRSLPEALGSLANDGHYIGLDEVKTGAFTFYVIQVETLGGVPVQLVRRVRGLKVAKPGRMLLRYSDGLKRLDEPVFALEYAADFLASGDDLAIFSPDDLLALLTDTQALASEVPAYLTAVSRTMPARLSPETLAAIEAKAIKSSRTALQLRRICRAPWIASVTEEALAEVLGEFQDIAEGIKQGPQGLDVTEDLIPLFLNLIEQRVWRGAFDHQVRQAQGVTLVG